MSAITIELPDDLIGALPCAADELSNELRLAAAIHWYQRGLVSQGRAAQIAGLSRVAFLDELARRKVDVFVVDLDDLKRELARG